jgi:hypothetical protein
METKKFTQFGTFSIIVIIPFLILSIYMIISSGFNELILFFTFGFLTLLLIVCLLILYKLTIYIDNTSVSFKLGIGLITRKYLITDIQSCKSVKVEPFFGIGIKITPNGWIYNVSGLNAIELSFKNKKSKVWIGTNKPDEIAGIINNMIKSDKPEYGSDYKAKSGYFFAATIIFLTIIFPIFLILSGSRETKVTTTNSDFSIKGIYGLTIKYSEIKKLDTIYALPRIRLRTNGYAFAKTHKGNFRLSDKENAKLFIRLGTPPYILIQTTDLHIYLNFRHPEETVDLFNTLKAKVEAEIK